MITRKWELEDSETLSSERTSAVGADSGEGKQFLVMNHYGDEFLDKSVASKWDEASQSWYADAEKLDRYGSVKGDSILCWAAAASNALFAQGWATGITISSAPVFATEDDVFEYYTKNWQDIGGFSSDGVGWWIDNSVLYFDYFNTAYLKDPYNPGGGFWTSTSISEVTPDHWLQWFYDSSDRKSTGDAVKENLLDYLTAGAVVDLSIYLYDSFAWGSGHAITCWGYETDASGRTWLYLSDSDDDKGTAADREAMPNRLQKIEITVESKIGDGAKELYLSNEYSYYDYAILGMTPVFRRDEDYDFQTKTNNSANAVGLKLAEDYSFSRSARMDRSADIDYFTFDLTGQKGTYLITLGSPFDVSAYNLTVSLYAGTAADGQLVDSMQMTAGSSYVFRLPSSGGGLYSIKVEDKGTDLSKLQNTSYTVTGEFSGTGYTGTINTAITLLIKDSLVDANVVAGGKVTAEAQSILQNVTLESGGVLLAAGSASIKNLTVQTGASATFAEGTVFFGSLSVAAPVTVEGPLSIKSDLSSLTLSIDGLKAGETLIAGSGAESLLRSADPEVVVRATQAKGTYKLAEAVSSDLSISVTEAGTGNTFRLKTGELYYTADTGYVLNRDERSGDLYFSITDSLVLDVGKLNVAVSKDQATLVWGAPSAVNEPTPTNYEVVVKGPATETTYTLGTGSTSLILANLPAGDYFCTVYAKYKEFAGKESSVSFTVTGIPDEPTPPIDPVDPVDPVDERPDLAFKSIRLADDGKSLEVTVVNRGKGDAGPFVLGFLAENSVFESSLLTMGGGRIKAGEEAVFTYLQPDLEIPGGTVTIYLDMNNDVEETNERNNEYVYSVGTVPVDPEPDPDPEVPVDPEKPVDPGKPEVPQLPPQDYYPKEKYTPKVVETDPAPSRSAVAVEALFEPDLVGRYYSLNGGKTWKKYKNPVKMNKNGTVLFRAETVFGESYTYAHEVTCIDKLKPVLQGASVGLEGRNVSVNFVADGTGSDVAKVQLKFKSRSTPSSVVESTGDSFFLSDLGYGKYSWQLRVYDEAGNASGWSKKQEFAVLNSAADTDGAISLTDGSAVMSGYVGIGDASDSYTFTLDRAGSFDLYAEKTDAKLKLGIYSNGKKVKTVTAKQAGSGMNGVLLDAGTYTVVVESADQGKGRYNTDYQVRLNGSFFGSATRDDDFNFAARSGSFRALEEASSNEWVGYGDPSDAYKFSLDRSTSLAVTTGADVKIELYNAAFRKMQTAQGSMLSKMLDPGDYYVNIVSANKGRNAAGNAYYNLAVSPV